MREIRLMRLVVGTDFDPETGPIRFTLSKASLNDSPTYRALSYVWGNSQDTRTAKVDGKDLQISSNLDSALRHLCTQISDYTLWVDAICINQKDNEEKTWQVGLMRDIYAQAELVIAWLGPAADDSEVAMDCLRKFGHEATSMGLQDSLLFFELNPEEQSETQSAKLARLPNSRQADQQSFEQLMALENDILSLTMTSGEKIPIPEVAIVALLNRPWFQRAWVLQEIVVAERAFFVCGEEWISVDAFRAAYVLLFLYQEEFLHREPRVFDTCVDMTPNVIYRFHNVVNKFMRYAHPFLTIRTIRHYRGVGLLFLLERTSPLANGHYLDCLDPRDRVYSLLGLLREDQSLGIHPDYNKSCNSVYIEVAEALLKVHGPLLLSMAQFRRVQQELPTWVPDWSIKCKGNSLLGNLNNDGRPPFSASKLTNFVYQVRCDQKGTTKLVVSGIQVDTIMETMSEKITESFVNCFSSDQGHGIINTKETSNLDEKSRATTQLLNSVYRFSEMAKAYPSAFGREEAAWRTTVADILLVRTPISERVPDVASNWIRADEDPNQANFTRAAYRMYLSGPPTSEQQVRYFNNVAVSQKLFAEDGPFGPAGKSFRSHFQNYRPLEENLSNLVNEMAETCSALIHLVLHGARWMCDDETSATIESGAQTARDLLQDGKEMLYWWLETYIGTLELEADVLDMVGEAESRSALYAPQMASRLNGKRIFVTSNGYLGLGSEYVEPGDVVVIILGAKMPFVLRKAEGQTFMLIGESYVHGIMDGEVMNDPKVLDIEII
ncbi:heterokaryon incompatibility protein-domain-containing protein [Bisporella sp. PMI_857]|nr:heterokaryon incompatibility protein-domain-containing protein [Bisporella sp. PMI_857]